MQIYRLFQPRSPLQSIRAVYTCKYIVFSSPGARYRASGRFTRANISSFPAQEPVTEHQGGLHVQIYRLFQPRSPLQSIRAVYTCKYIVFSSPGARYRASGRFTRANISSFPAQEPVTEHQGGLHVQIYRLFQPRSPLQSIRAVYTCKYIVFSSPGARYRASGRFTRANISSFPAQEPVTEHQGGLHVQIYRLFQPRSPLQSIRAVYTCKYIVFSSPEARYRASGRFTRANISSFPAQEPVTEREREMFYLTTHSTHFIYGYMASDIWLRTILIVRKETRCRHIGYSYRLTPVTESEDCLHVQIFRLFQARMLQSIGAVYTGNMSWSAPHGQQFWRGSEQLIKWRSHVLGYYKKRLMQYTQLQE